MSAEKFIISIISASDARCCRSEWIFGSQIETIGFWLAELKLLLGAG
jgi:hypothetical protein